METRAVAEILGPWVEPGFNSSLIERYRANWSVPIGEITNYVLATFIRQRIALDFVVSEAQRRIASGFTDETEILDDELALAIAEIFPNDKPRPNEELREYQVIWWTDDSARLGERLTVLALSLDDASKQSRTSTERISKVAFGMKMTLQSRVDSRCYPNRRWPGSASTSRSLS